MTDGVNRKTVTPDIRAWGDYSGGCLRECGFYRGGAPDVQIINAFIYNRNDAGRLSRIGREDQGKMWFSTAKTEARTSSINPGLVS